jgi:glycosyltransferase involved in cell wall biosynthesis
VIVLIPAYEPGDRLAPLVADVFSADPDLAVVIVDDGSGPDFAAVFDRAAEAGARVLTHDRNRGKGAALKTGFALVRDEFPGEDVVTADADGQHTVTDILRIADELRVDAADGASTIVLGSRAFTGRVPARSRIGNAIARGLFRVAAGRALSDTQTGLRGIPSTLLGWSIDQPGTRFEYEQNVLLRAARGGIALTEVPIETVYLDHNASSHFRPLVDSARVMVPVLRFAASSFVAFLVDTVALLVLTSLTGWLAGSVVIARLLSASVNFAVNRRYVFRATGGATLGRQALRYAMLAALLLASNLVWMQALTDAGVPLLVAKVVTETVLFATSYGVQRSVVFPREASAASIAASQTPHSNRIASPGGLGDDPRTIGHAS